MTPRMPRWQIVASVPIWALRVTSDVASAVSGILQTHVENIRLEVFGLANATMTPTETEQVARVWAEKMERKVEAMQQPYIPPSTETMPVDQIIALGARSGMEYQGPTTTAHLDN